MEADAREDLGILRRAIALEIHHAIDDFLPRAPQDQHDVDRAARARSHENQFHRAWTEIAPPDVGTRIDHDAMAAAALGDERHAVGEHDSRLHAFALSACAIPSHAFVIFQPTARSAGPTKSPMKPNAIAPPNTPRTTSSIERLPARLMRIGLRTLSKELSTRMP